ncbi:MAG: beta strand repeat-containing protein, partial [Planctomycetota bacterium]
QTFGNSDGALAVALQSDGKIVISGWTANGETGVIRLNTDGSLDTTFNSTGMFTGGVSGYDQGASLVIQSDGKIVVGGHGNAGSGPGFFMMRLNANGTLDTSFSPGGDDGDGKLVTWVATNPEYGNTLALQSDGKILMTGVSNGTFGIVRVNSDGSLDNSFGTAGKVSVNVGPGNDESRHVIVLPDGKLIVVGQSVNTATDSTSDFSIIRLNADGSLDTTFNGTSGNGLGATLSYTENGSPIVLAGLVQVTDAELTAANNFNGATLTLGRSGVASSQDVFSATGTLSALTQGGNLVVGGTTIGSVTTNSGGTLVLTFNSSATNALVNSAMHQICYSNSSDSPSASVQINWTFSDGNSGTQGAGGALTATGSVAINITSVNDAPTITSGYIHTLTGTNEDTTSSGTLASAILTGASWADIDTGAISGLAITAVTGNGTWQYSTDGTTWANFGAVSTTNALLITSSSQVRYIPNGQNGETATFTYKAWDQTSGTPSTNATPSYASTASSGGTTAFSTNNATAQITVTSVNDAPTITSGYTHTLTGTNEDTTSSGTLATAILTGSSWADVDTGAVSGLAITAVTGNGTWQYSTDGTTWANFGAVSNTNALLITSSSQVRYIPNGQNGETATFTYKAWDQTSGTASTNATASYASTASSGGSTAFSTNNATAQIIVSSVNDAPIFSAASSGGGFNIISFGNGLEDQANRVARQFDGKLLVVGTTNSDYGVLRLNADGTIDNTFGSGGKVSIDVGGTDTARNIRVLSNGKILLVGRSSNGSDNDFTLVRLNADGSLDTSFDSDGKLLVPVGTIDNSYDLIVQTDGKMIVVGQVDEDFGIIRLNTDGSLDTTFSGDGKLTQTFGNSDGALAVALQSDGKIVISGWTANGETGV